MSYCSSQNETLKSHHETVPSPLDGSSEETAAQQEPQMIIQPARLRSAASITSVKSLSSQQTLGLPASKPTTSVNLTNHFTSSLARTLLSEQESSYERSSSSPPQNIEIDSLEATLDLFSIQDELASSMHSPSYVPLRALPNPFKRSKEDVDGPKLPQRKQFLILTSAGKLVYSMNGQEEYIMGLMGVIHTIINYFQLNGDGDNLRVITTYGPNGVQQKFSFLRKKYIVLVAMTTLNESESELHQQLDLLYSFLISRLSLRQLNRLFGKRENFDLRGFLSESDFHNLDRLCNDICLGTHPGWLLGALECVTLKKSVRSHIHSIMLNAISELPSGSLLYGLIVASDHRLVSVMRPRGHTLHTTDLQLLFSMMENHLQLLDNSQEAWVPVCFPKFNGNGFLYCYVKFLPSTVLPSAQQVNTIEGNPLIKPAILLISPQTNSFYKLREVAAKIIAELSASNILQHISYPLRITINNIPAPLVHHFIYKSRKHVQYVMPETSCMTDWLTLMKYYAHLRSAVFTDYGHPLKKSLLTFMRWSSSLPSRSHFAHTNTYRYDDEAHFPENEISTTPENYFVEEDLDMLSSAWVTPHFELYLICNNATIDRELVVKSARNIINWCKHNESKIFVADGAVF